MDESALCLSQKEWDDLEVIAGAYLGATAWVTRLPVGQTRYGRDELEPIRRRRELATRIVESNR